MTASQTGTMGGTLGRIGRRAGYLSLNQQSTSENFCLCVPVLGTSGQGQEWEDWMLLLVGKCHA